MSRRRERVRNGSDRGVHGLRPVSAEAVSFTARSADRPRLHALAAFRRSRVRGESQGRRSERPQTPAAVSRSLVLSARGLQVLGIGGAIGTLFDPHHRGPAGPSKISVTFFPDCQFGPCTSRAFVYSRASRRVARSRPWRVLLSVGFDGRRDQPADAVDGPASCGWRFMPALLPMEEPCWHDPSNISVRDLPASP